MAPDHIEAALKENVKLKLEILNLSKEMKKLKKLLLQQDRDLAEAARNANGNGGKGGAETMELERLYREEKERRKAAEAERKRLGEELANGAGGEDELEKLRAQVDDTEASEQVWRERCEALEEELENAKVAAEDHAEELERVRDAADRAQEEVERLQAQQADPSKALHESVGVGKGREARMQQKLAELEQVRLVIISPAGSANDH
jgi:chromosome segregation ATPase